MSARGARRAKEQITAANRRPHSNPPSGERLRRENERLLRENEELRRKLTQRDQQLAEAEKQIADAENHLPPTDWPAIRGRAEQNARAGANRAPSRDTPGIIGGWFPPPR